MSRLRIVIALLFVMPMAQAQDSATLHFHTGVLYNSGLNYYGRVDSLKSKGICPFAGLSFSNGLYVNSTFVFVENPLQSQYAATLLEAGYNFTNENKKWSGNLSVSRFFYQADIDLVQSAVKEMASASISRLNNIVNVNLSASARWSNQVDYNAQAGLDHLIRIPRVLTENGVLVIDPTVTASAGTQSFTTTYIEQKHFLFLPTQEQAITASSRKFNILAYEISCPVVYGLGKMKFLLSPAYVMPQNLLTGSETGANLFYITAMIKLTL